MTDSPAHPPPSDQAGEDDKPLDDNRSTPADDGSSKVGQATVTPVGVHRNRSNRSAERSLNRMLRPRSPADMGISAFGKKRSSTHSDELQKLCKTWGQSRYHQRLHQSACRQRPQRCGVHRKAPGAASPAAQRF